jgi:mannose/fructose/N-acetylgalactosamine-specific phosphotransferase system component IIB
MAGATELYTTAEAHGEANIMAQEDLSKQAIAIAIAQREQVVAEREQAVHEKEEEIAGMLDREGNELLSRETNLNTREASLEADQKSLADLHVDVLAHELTTDLKANHLEFRENELADREKQLAVTQPVELAAT